MRQLLVVLVGALGLVSCGSNGEVSSLDDFSTREVTLPDGSTVKAEVLTKPVDMARGMMFRESFPEGRGMLFVHQAPGKYPYWMYQTKVPLDIVWMDKAGKIVEVNENTPPCPGKASTCPSYGGTADASLVLELPAGYGRKHGVRIGETVRV
jgi:uncharacterized membrane protein (UPF0127 family)